MQTPSRFLRRASTLLAGGLLLCGAASATHAQTVIPSLPYTITTGGLYVLNSNLVSSQTSGNLITVNASNVTIDFQNHYIAGAVNNPDQTTTGISAFERSNLTVRNGIVAYCFRGIEIDGNSGAATNSVNHKIENIRVTNCSQFGIVLSYAPGSRVTDCQVSQTGYSGTSTAPLASASSARARSSATT